CRTILLLTHGRWPLGTIGMPEWQLHPLKWELDQGTSEELTTWQKSNTFAASAQPYGFECAWGLMALYQFVALYLGHLIRRPTRASPPHHVCIGRLSCQSEGELC